MMKINNKEMNIKLSESQKSIDKEKSKNSNPTTEEIIKVEYPQSTNNKEISNISNNSKQIKPNSDSKLIEKIESSPPDKIKNFNSNKESNSLKDQDSQNIKEEIIKLLEEKTLELKKLINQNQEKVQKDLEELKVLLNRTK